MNFVQVCYDHYSGVFSVEHVGEAQAGAKVGIQVVNLVVIGV